MNSTITMTKYLCTSNGWSKAPETTDFRRVSRWITVQHNYTPNKRNHLWDYVTDENGYKPYSDKFNPANGLYLDFFRYNGRTYAVEQFLRLGSMMIAVAYSYETADGKTAYLSAVDGEDLYHPLYVEFDECCERVRVYEEVA